MLVIRARVSLRLITIRPAISSSITRCDVAKEPERKGPLSELGYMSLLRMESLSLK